MHCYYLSGLCFPDTTSKSFAPKYAAMSTAIPTAKPSQMLRIRYIRPIYHPKVSSHNVGHCLQAVIHQPNHTAHLFMSSTMPEGFIVISIHDGLKPLLIALRTERRFDHAEQ